MFLIRQTFSGQRVREERQDEAGDDADLQPEGQQLRGESHDTAFSVVLVKHLDSPSLSLRCDSHTCVLMCFSSVLCVLRLAVRSGLMNVEAPCTAPGSAPGSDETSNCPTPSPPPCRVTTTPPSIHPSILYSLHLVLNPSCSLSGRV